jgi:hypothetical protein
MGPADCWLRAPGDDGNRTVYAGSGGIAVGDDGNRPENQRADCHPPLRYPGVAANAFPHSLTWSVVSG